jgi:hypothetical protein
MSSHIIVKVKYADDIRKAALPISEVNTFTTMANWIAETYNLDGSNNLMLKYKDEDGDLVTMINDDDLQLALTSQQKLYIYAFVCEESSAASNNGSRRASSAKTESVAVIHPSCHEEEHLSSPKCVMSSQRHEHHHHLQASPSSQSTREDFASMNGIPSQGHREQQQRPPSRSANLQSYGPSQHHQRQSYSGLPPPHPTQQHRQLQQQPSYSSIPAPYNHREQQQPPSYPPQSAPPRQQFPPSSMNGMPPLQQQQPSYPPQQSQPPMNGMPPQQQQPTAPHSGIQQQFAPTPLNGIPPPPSSQHYQLQQPSYPPPQQFVPSLTRPGLGNPFARLQHPGQR